MPIFTLESSSCKDQHLAKLITDELEPSDEYEKQILLEGLNELMRLEYEPHPKLMEQVLEQLKIS